MSPRRKKYICVILALGVCAVAAVAAVMGSGTTTPTLDYIAAALREQAALPLEAEYVYEPRNPEAGSTRDVVHYVRIPEALFMERRVEKLDGDWILESTQRASYETASGEYRTLSSWVHESEVGGRLTHSSPQSFREALTMESAWLWVSGGPLFEKVKAGALSDQPETIDGHPCWKVTTDTSGTTNPRLLIVVWLDPTIGFCPRRVEWTYFYPEPRGTVKVTNDFSEYRDAGNGAWFPGKRVVAGSEGWSSVVAAKSVRVPVGASKENLIVRFPAGAKIAMDDGTVVTVP